MLDHRIDVQSTPGRGTVFSIEVPRGHSSCDTTERAQTPRFERGDFPDSILVVEDEKSVRVLAKSPAENERHRGDRGRNGE